MAFFDFEEINAKGKNITPGYASGEKQFNNVTVLKALMEERMTHQEKSSL